MNLREKIRAMWRPSTDRVPLQIAGFREKLIDRRIAEIAYNEYAEQQDISQVQSFERVCERGGFGISETMILLSCAVIRANENSYSRYSDFSIKGDIINERRSKK